MYVYGPVPSRRLGRSLGVSPIPPKTCSYACVYCQLGKTTHLQTERKDFYPKEEILAEIIESEPMGKADFITFVGDGEPTLNKDLGWLIKQTKQKINLPVAVITNGSLLSQKDVRENLSAADVVIPTLDAGNDRMFRMINRPHRDIDFETMLQGLVEFRREYSGQIRIEVMLVKGLNDTDGELTDIKRAIEKINPDRVYILTPIRPPAEAWVRPLEPEDILRALEIIGSGIPVTELETGQFSAEEFKDAKHAILEIGSRHPLRLDQGLNIENKFSTPGTVMKMLKNKDLIRVNYNGNDYLLPGHFRMGK